MTPICADRNTFAENGYFLSQSILSKAEVSSVNDRLDRVTHPVGQRMHLGSPFAIRDVFAASPDLLEYARDGLLFGLASSLLEGDVRPTKATLFDKHADANWSLPLHQDLTITVHERVEVQGFGPWTTKAGVPHVRPPEHVLQSILALRVHLDDCPEDNGALQVVPGSHKLGRLSSGDLKSMVGEMRSIPVPAHAGDVLAMSPLLVHGSGKANRPSRRRVLHIEYSNSDLPAPLRWPIWNSSPLSLRDG